MIRQRGVKDERRSNDQSVAAAAAVVIQSEGRCTSTNITVQWAVDLANYMTTNHV